MKFEVGELAILNQHALKGLPDRVGEVVEIISSAIKSPNYDYIVEVDNGDFIPVKEKELNHLSMPELDLITYIKRGNKVLYAPMDMEAEIVKVDYIHGQAEVKFYDSAMSIIDFEQLRPIEKREEETVLKSQFKIGDQVKIKSQDKYSGKVGIISDIYSGGNEHAVNIDGKEILPFAEEELELLSEEQHEKELHFELLFGHFEQEDGNYLVPKQLLHNLLNKIL